MNIDLRLRYGNQNNEWETPQWFFNKYNDIYHFDLDVCALPHNAKCKRFFTPEIDGLKQEWRGKCWMNPPFGNNLGKWIIKAYESSVLHCATVVCLLPVRTETGWWHDYVMKGDIEFIRGRLTFVGANNVATFASAVVVFNGEREVRKRAKKLLL